MEEEQWVIENNEEAQMYDILTGNLKYLDIPYLEEELEPDLVLTWKIPSKKYIQKSQYFPVSSYISNPSYKLRKMTTKAEKDILDQMARTNQQQKTDSIRYRFQQSLEECQVKVCHSRYVDKLEEVVPFTIECVHQMGGRLDIFKIQYNAIMYTLQRVCGFRARPFLLYDQELGDKTLYIFLNLSLDNRLKIATRYRMKKEIDYSLIDFFLNEPTGKDQRPLKLHSMMEHYPQLRTDSKRVSRYFKMVENQFGTVIIDEAPLCPQTQWRFLNHQEEVDRLMKYYKKVNNTPNLSKHEKQYLYQYNNYKLNQGCQLLYHQFLQRKQFFDLVYYLSDYHGFKSIQAPEMYEQFMIPGKGYSGQGYFQKLKAILLYKPQQVSPDGKLDLFLKMEKIKLAYIVLKSTFTINTLNQMGINFLALHNDFQLKGTGGTTEIAGGVDGQNVVSGWPFYTFFANTNVIRNYFGNNVGMEIAFKVYILHYFMGIVVPYTFIYIFQLVFKSLVYSSTNVVKSVILAISFKMFLTIWTIFQDNYVQKFQDDISSKVLRSDFRGPYIRDPLTDKVNQYMDHSVLQLIIKNLLWGIFMMGIWSIFGGVFFGCRMFVVEIYNSMSQYQALFLSIPHLLSYSLYFIFIELVRILLFDQFVRLLIYFKDPASDDDARRLAQLFKFTYIFGIEMIPPLFFLVIEPFAGTSCFSKSCIDEIRYYVYARYTALLFEVLVRSIRGFIIKHKIKAYKSISTLLEDQDNKQDKSSFEYRLTQLLMKAVEENDKPNHENTNALDLIAIISFGIYNILLPLQVLISLVYVGIETYNVRMFILKLQRRTVSKSQAILRKSLQLNIIYYSGLLINSWTQFFTITTLQKSNPGLIELLLPTITASDLNLLKIGFVVAFFIGLVIIGQMSAVITRSVVDYWLQTRRRIKFDAYWIRGHTKKQKSINIVPPKIIPTIFRTFNPKKMPHQLLDQMLTNQFNILPQNMLVQLIVQDNSMMSLMRTRKQLL